MANQEKYAHCHFDIMAVYCQHFIERTIPMEIISLIKAFWSFKKIWKMWNLHKDAIAFFFERERYKLWTIETSGATFQLILYPLFSKLKFQLILLSMPDCVRKMRIYFEFINQSSNRRYQFTKLFKHTFDRHIDANYEWELSSEILDVDEFKQDTLKLSSCLDVLRVEYEPQFDNIDRVNYFKPVELPKIAEYVFDRTFDDTEIGESVRSKPFGNGCWWLQCKITASHYYENRLRLVRLNKQTKRVLIRCDIKCDDPYGTNKGKYDTTNSRRGMMVGNVWRTSAPVQCKRDSWWGLTFSGGSKRYSFDNRIRFKIRIEILAEYNK